MTQLLVAFRNFANAVKKNKAIKSVREKGEKSGERKNGMTEDGKKKSNTEDRKTGSRNMTTLRLSRP
jgi:hypothetical protein